MNIIRTDERDRLVTPAVVLSYLRSRPWWMRGIDWLGGRRYSVTRFTDRPYPLVIVAHCFRDAPTARSLSLVIERDWMAVPAHCRNAYDEILFQAPGLIVVQLRRQNLCGCLGHRHPVVREAPFRELHEAFGGLNAGEMDIAWRRAQTWRPLPISDGALDAKFLEGSRLDEFHTEQFCLKLLSILLHEIHHLVSPHAPESLVRQTSLAFYHDGVAHYVEGAMSTLSLTIDRSFSRFG